MAAEQFGSFNPDSFAQGGFMDDVDATIMKARVVTFDYNGTINPPVCALQITFRPDEGDADGSDDRIEHYSMGPTSKFVPSKDNLRFLTVTEGAALQKSTKAAHLITSLQKQGFAKFPEMAKSTEALEGLHVHLNVIALPAIKAKKEGEKDRDNSVLAVTKIHDEPAAWTKAKKVGAGKTAAAAATPAAAKPAAKAAAKPASVEEAAEEVADGAAEASGDGASDPLEDATVEAILGLLAEKPSIKKPELTAAIFKVIKDPATKQAAVRFVSKADWLGSEERPWKYEGGVISSI